VGNKKLTTTLLHPTIMTVGRISNYRLNTESRKLFTSSYNDGPEDVISEEAELHVKVARLL
jgi:hypothetical protein